MEKMATSNSNVLKIFNFFTSGPLQNILLVSMQLSDKILTFHSLPGKYCPTQQKKNIVTTQTCSIYYGMWLFSYTGQSIQRTTIFSFSLKNKGEEYYSSHWSELPQKHWIHSPLDWETGKKQTPVKNKAWQADR